MIPIFVLIFPYGPYLAIYLACMSHSLFLPCVMHYAFVFEFMHKILHANTQRHAHTHMHKHTLTHQISFSSDRRANPD